MGVYAKIIALVTGCYIALESGSRVCHAWGTATIDTYVQYVNGNSGDSYAGGETLSCSFRIVFDNGGNQNPAVQDWSWTRCFDAASGADDGTVFTGADSTSIKYIDFVGATSVIADANKECMCFFVQARNDGEASNWQYHEIIYTEN